MADERFIGGATPGDLSVAANWSTSGPPSAGEDVVIEPNNPTEDITAGLTTGVKWGKVQIGPTYAGKFGISAASPVVMGASKLNVSCNSTQLFIKGASGGNEIDQLILAERLNGNVQSRCTIDGTIDEVYIADWLVTILAMTTGQVTVMPLAGKTPIVDVDGAATITSFVLGGGVCNINLAAAAITTYYQSGGETTHTDGAVTNVVLHGGDYYWYDDATVTSVTIYGGSFIAGGPGRHRTNTLITQYGGTLDLSRATPGITDYTTIKRFGGEFIPPPGATIAIS